MKYECPNCGEDFLDGYCETGLCSRECADEVALNKAHRELSTLRAQNAELTAENERLKTQSESLARSVMSDHVSNDSHSLFIAAIRDLAAINEHLDLDPDDGGAVPIIGAIDELRAALASARKRALYDAADDFEAGASASDIRANADRLSGQPVEDESCYCASCEELAREVESKQAKIDTAQKADAYPQAHRLALELECFLLSCQDTAATAKWWDSANEALEQWREFNAKFNGGL